MPLHVADHWKPMPELVAEPGEMYEVLDSRNMPGLPSNGMTDKKHRRLWTPFEEQGRPVAHHELGHVRWSPETYELGRLGVPFFVMLAVEDARVNLGLHHFRMPLVFDDQMRDQIVRSARENLDRRDVASFTLRAVASFGTNVQPLLESLAGSEALPHFEAASVLVAGTAERFEHAHARLRVRVVPFEEGVRIARWLATELDERGHPVPAGRGLGIGCCGGIEGGKPGRGRRGGRGGGRPRDGVLPGRMRTVTVPLRRPFAPTLPSTTRRHRPAAEGTELRYMHRFVADQSVFSRRMRRTAPGGSVLIDASGSMSLSAAHIDRIIEHAPAATLVATYAGSDDEGELRIVVRNGRRAAPGDLQPAGNGNIVDLPALEWLARQPAPRVWISDGGVTGCGDIATAALKQRCREICRSAGIQRVRDAARAAKLLGRL